MLPPAQRKESEGSALQGATDKALVAEGLSVGDGFARYSLTVAPGECVLLSGPSGSGKSRFLRLVADLDPGLGRARIGTILRDDVPAYEWRRIVTYVPSESGWWGARVAMHMPDEGRARQMLARLGLPERLMDAAPHAISTGERQRLAIIRALVLRPRFLLLDEPTSALDLESALQVEDILMSAKRDGTGLLVVSHDHRQISRIADRHYTMSPEGLSEFAP